MNTPALSVEERTAIVAVWMARLHTPPPVTRNELQVMRETLEAHQWQQPLLPFHQALCAVLETDTAQQAHVLAAVAAPFNAITRALFAVIQNHLAAEPES